MRKELDLNELNTVAGGVVIKPGMPFIPPYKPTRLDFDDLPEELQKIVKEHFRPKEGQKPAWPISAKPFPKPFPIKPKIIE